MSRLKPLLALSLILLGACQTALSNNACGVVISYTPEFLQKTREQYASLPPETRQLIDDYMTTRDTIRECEKGK